MTVSVTVNGGGHTWARLTNRMGETAAKLEREFGDMQDFEFTVQDSRKAVKMPKAAAS